MELNFRLSKLKKQQESIVFESSSNCKDCVKSLCKYHFGQDKYYNGKIDMIKELLYSNSNYTKKTNPPDFNMRESYKKEVKQYLKK